MCDRVKILSVMRTSWLCLAMVFNGVSGLGMTCQGPELAIFPSHQVRCERVGQRTTRQERASTLLWSLAWWKERVQRGGRIGTYPLLVKLATIAHRTQVQLSRGCGCLWAGTHSKLPVTTASWVLLVAKAELSICAFHSAHQHLSNHIRDDIAPLIYLVCQCFSLHIATNS